MVKARRVWRKGALKLKARAGGEGRAFGAEGTRTDRQAAAAAAASTEGRTITWRT